MVFSAHAASCLTGLLLAGTLMLSAGCATQRVIREEKPLSETDFFMTRAGDEVTLSWKSDPAINYTIIYTTSLSGGAPWQVLPGHDFIRGTGRTLTYKDRVPAGVNRYYRLQMEPAVGR